MTVLRSGYRYTQDQWRFLEGLAERRAKQGLPLPDAIANRPTVDEVHRDLWEAFHDLSSARSAGFAADPIPCSEVQAWCSVHGVARWRVPMFWRAVHALDMEALKLSAEKGKATA